jgi:hypothetical protein
MIDIQSRSRRDGGTILAANRIGGILIAREWANCWNSQNLLDVARSSDDSKPILRRSPSMTIARIDAFEHFVLPATRKPSWSTPAASLLVFAVLLVR